MSFLGAINGMRDRNIIRSAYNGQQSSNDAEDAEVHEAVLRRIGRQAAEDGLSLEDAYALYDEYMEGRDAAVEEETELEGEDPANLNDLNDDEEAW